MISHNFADLGAAFETARSFAYWTTFMLQTDSMASKFQAFFDRHHGDVGSFINPQELWGHNPFQQT